MLVKIRCRDEKEERNMMIGKKLYVILLAVMMTVMIVPLLGTQRAFAGDGLDPAGANIAVGIGGDPLELTLSGSGKMYDFSGSPTPWDSRKSDIQEVYIGAHITDVSAGAFTDMPQLKTVWLPNTIETIDKDAFKNCPSLKTVYYRGYYKDLSELISEITPEGTSDTILRAADWCCVDQGHEYTLRFPSFNADGNPYLRVTEYNKNLMIYSYLEYLVMGVGKASVRTNIPAVDEDYDFGKDATFDMNVLFADNNNYFDVTYTALPGGTTGTLCSETIGVEANRYLYDQQCPFYSRFTIVVPTKLTDSNVSLNKTGFPWTGSSIKPVVTIKANGSKLKEGTDYTVVFSDNKAIGTAKVTVEGKGDYYGIVTKSFKITKADNPLKVSGKKATVKYGKLKKKAQTMAVTKVMTFKKKINDKKAYTLSSAKKGSKSFKKYFKINKATGKVTVKKGLKKGTYKVKVKVKAAGNAHYKASTKSVTFKIIVK